MNILLSAFACAPNIGSEAGSGWKWALQLASKHHVSVITDISREQLIESGGSLPENLEILYYRPWFLQRLPLNSATAQFIYISWQYCILPFAINLHRSRRFDLAIHLTYGVFRHPSFLGFLGIPFVFGPVGGGEDAPWRLKRSLPLSEKLRELVRSCINLAARINPFLLAALSKADLVIARTTETLNALPRWPISNHIVFQEIGTPGILRKTPISTRDMEKPLEILFAGRLLGLKGIHLGIAAVSTAISNGVSCRLTIIGSGPCEKWLKAEGIKHGLNEMNLKWIPHMPQQDLFQIYETSHCLLFPSLHDSGGNVVLEAISFGVPVICLDLGGPPTLVDDNSSIVVSTKGNDEAGVILGLAQAIQSIGTNEKYRLKLADGALSRSKDMTWPHKIDRGFKIMQDRLGLQ